MELFPSNSKINFMKIRVAALVVFTALAVAAAGALFARGFNYALDFTGGTVVELEFQKPVDVEGVSAAELGRRSSGREMVLDESAHPRIVQTAGLDTQRRPRFHVFFHEALTAPHRLVHTCNVTGGIGCSTGRRQRRSDTSR